MGDIDFDELDKAVTSVLGAQKAKESVASSETNTVDDNISASSSTTSDRAGSEAPKTEEVHVLNDHGDDGALPLREESQEDRVNVTSIKPPQVHKGRSGKVMDVVPPKGLYNKTGKGVNVAQTTSRTGVSIQPAVEHNEDEQDDSLPEVQVYSGKTRAINGSRQETVAAESDQDNQSKNDDTSLLNDTKDTPFISGSSPEKRPLGSAAEHEDDAAGEEISSEKNDSKNSTEVVDIDHDMNRALEDALQNEPQKRDDNESAKQSSLPEELSADVVAVESVQIAPDPQVSVNADSAAPHSEDEAIPTQHVGKTRPKTREETPVIFDTNSYESTSPQKKDPSGVLNVFIILVLILFGAALGAVAFYISYSELI